MALPQQKHLSQGSCWVLLLGDPHPGVCVACQDACSPPVSLVLPTCIPPGSQVGVGLRRFIVPPVCCSLCPLMLSFLSLVSVPYGGLCGVLGYGCWCSWIGGLWVWLLLWLSPLWVFFCLSLWVNLFFFLACFSSVIFPFCEFCFVHWRNLFSLWVLH